jgi:hypothetical protein
MLITLTPVEGVGSMLFGRVGIPLQPTQNPNGDLSNLVLHLVPDKPITLRELLESESK